MPTKLINADLEITSSEDLAPIKEVFDQSEFEFALMHCGEISAGVYLASFEVHQDKVRDDPSAEERIHAFWKVAGSTLP